MAPVRTSPLEVSRFVAEMLAGRHGHEGVRRVVAHPERYGVGERLDEELPGGAPWAFELVRSKYKPARKLTAYYTARSGGPEHHEQSIAVSWSPQDDGAGPRVLVSPADPAMPQLARLTRPGHVASLVQEMSGSPVGAATTRDVRTVRYRPGQRHVLVVGLGSGAGSVYVKADRDNAGAVAVPVARQLRGPLARRRPGAAIAEPVGYCAEDSAALWWQAPGQLMSVLLAARGSDWSAAVARTGRLLRVLHEVAAVPGAPVGPGPARVAHPHGEAAAVVRAADHIGTLLPELARTYVGLVADAVQALDELPSEEPLFSHGDFKADNILLDRGEPRVLDLDRCGLADPAMDLGKFLADLAWWCPDRRDLAGYSRAFQDGYGPCDPARWLRAGPWSMLFRLKHTARRCPVHDPEWPAHIRGRLAAAAVAAPMITGSGR